MEKDLLKRCIAVVMSALMVVSGIQPFTKAPESKAATKYVIEDPSEYYQAITRNRVSVHDPAIVKDPDSDRYYIFGSHLAWAYSTDLETWTTFKNNISTDYNTMFKSEFEWAKAGDSVYDPSGNIWAPDVIWNPNIGKNGKWCMYMSINGCSWNSVICLLTADKLDGDWKYVGPVVYSGFTREALHDYTKTDYLEVTGEDSLPNRFVTEAYKTKDNKTVCEATTWQKSYGAHAIDANVFFDEDGKLWFAYGSWSGGLYMFPLDKNTGFRDTSVKYEYSEENHTDPYMGQKIGGSGASGEATYIKHIGDYYYFFTSYGGLGATGGYNMRVFRSQNPDGPYTDVSGDAALSGGDVNGSSGKISGKIGTRLMGYYKWSYWKYAQVAQGHNSVYTDENGKSYVIYHTRTNDGTEGHTVRVHQLFTTKSGYLVAAPFEYSTSDTVKTSYSTDEIAGDYEILFQNNTNYAQLEYNKPSTITLTKEGKITKAGSEIGTWTEEAGSANVNITYDGTDYEGTFVTQTMEETNVKTLCFTVVGEKNSVDTCLWGAKYPSDDIAVAMTATRLDIQKRVTDNLDLTTEGAFGAEISWKSSSPFIMEDGTVIRMKADADVTLTATITKGDYVCEKELQTTVASSVLKASKVASYYTDEPLDLTKGTASVDNPLKDADIKNGMSFKFKVKRTGAFGHLDNATIFGLDVDKKFYFTGGTYFGYNNAAGIMDANLYCVDYTAKQYQAGVDFLGDAGVTSDYVPVEIKVTASGFEVFVNEAKVYDNTSIDSRNKEDKATATSVPEGKVPGQNNTTDYSKVLDIITSSEKINFGLGSWWDGSFQGLLKDFEVWVEPVAQKEELAENFYYSEDYESYKSDAEVSGIWSNGNVAKALKKADDNTYLVLTPSGSGNRGSSMSFDFGEDTKPTGEFVFETDIQLNTSTGGSAGTTPATQFALVGDSIVYDYYYDTNNKKVQNENIGISSESNYILRLNAAATGTENKGDIVYPEKFVINDGSDGVGVAILRGTWVHLSVRKDSDSKYYLKITKKSDNSVILAEKEITPKGNVDISGIYVLLGRGNGSSIYFDNTVVKKPGLADYSKFNAALSNAKKLAALQAETNVYSTDSFSALSTAITNADAIAKDLSEDDQSTLDDAVTALNTAIEGLTCSTHVYDEGEIIEAATCTEPGSKKATCYYCGHEETIEIPAGHSWGEWELTKAATESTKGTKTRKCKNCDEIETADVDFCGDGNHVFKVKTTKEASCKEEGERILTCSVCGHSEVQKLEKTEHTPGEWEITEAATETKQGTKIQKCIVCGKVIEEKHMEACAEHSFDKGKVIKAATCQEAGVMTYTCTECGLTETKGIPILNHTIGDWEVTKVATTTEEGERVRKCTECGEVLESEKIAKLTDSSSSGTGTGTDKGTSTDQNAGTTTPAATGTDDKTASSGTTTSSTTSDDKTAEDTDTTELKVGAVQTSGSYKYKVTSATKKTVTLTAVTKKTITSAKVGYTVKLNGTKYKVTQIGASAFANCKKLKKITIGTNITAIGKKAFYNDSKLKTITINSKKLTKVGSNAFKGINKKAKISVPKAKKTAYKKLLKKKGQAGTVKIK